MKINFLSVTPVSYYVRFFPDQSVKTHSISPLALVRSRKTDGKVKIEETIMDNKKVERLEKMVYLRSKQRKEEVNAELAKNSLFRV